LLLAAERFEAFVWGLVGASAEKKINDAALVRLEPVERDGGQWADV
jgi:hypothetical protein